ncbi:hypothetical protein NHQ30_000131 [Ciborinia camelliae]|nr:hypothetical protein NHQ30_000131 [Ciborinia camelliae]
MEHLTKTGTTVSLSEECIVMFDMLSDDQPQWSEDQLARFKIWISTLGVFENGHASIDYRLRDHSDVLKLIIQQLEVLKLNLEKLRDLVFHPVQSQFQKREKVQPESLEIDGEIFDYESPTSETSFSSSDLGFEKNIQSNPRKEDLQIVQDTISRLNALSTAIKRAGKQSRVSKADLYEVIEYVDGVKINVTTEFQKYATAIVAREIPDTEPFLKERLIVSISRRRNRFLYWKRHDKSSKIYIKKVTPSRLIKDRGTPQTNISQTKGSNIGKQNYSRDERTVMTGFTATTFDAKNFRKPAESTRASIKPSGSVLWKNREEFPKPPKLGGTESHFICPICHVLTPAREAKGDMWVQHVTRDLKPYICIFDGCKEPQAAFDNFQDWIKHMKEEQMPTEWHCASGSHPLVRFRSRDLFDSHMREQHSRGLIEAQLQALANRNMRFASDVLTSCPFCSHGLDEGNITQSSILKDQDELQYHVSRHLLSLAFISLPPLDDGDSTGSERSESSRVSFDSRIDQSETTGFPQFDDTTHNREDLAEDSIQLANKLDCDWTCVWGFLRNETTPHDDSVDSVIANLLKMKQQQEQTPTQEISNDDNSGHQQKEVNENSLGASFKNDLKAEILGTSHIEDDIRRFGDIPIDGVLASAVAGGVARSEPSTEARHDEAEYAQRQTLADRQKMLGPEHPETLTSINNLAQALFFQGKYKEAEEVYRHALAGREKILGQGHLDTIKSLNNLAQALVYLGHFKAAEELYRRALAEGEKTLGLEHPYVLQNIHNLGGAFRNQGQHKKAEELYRKALAGREKVLGPEHPDTLQSVNNLGGTFEKMGQYEEAEELYRQALKGRVEVLGAEHADTLQSVHNIGGALRNQGRYKEAEILYRRALTGREKTLGRNHPNTLRSLNNLALALEKQENYTEAEHIYRQALAAREEVLEKEHPDTLQSINNIGSVRLNQLDYSEAESLYRQGFEGRKRIFGLDHPDTLQSISNLGKALEKLGRHEESEDLFRKALEGKEKLLGQEHPHTLQSADDLAAVLGRRERLDQGTGVGEDVID